MTSFCFVVIFFRSYTQWLLLRGQWTDKNYKRNTANGRIRLNEADPEQQTIVVVANKPDTHSISDETREQTTCRIISGPLPAGAVREV